jgi:RNAse (barnase) inhibitor barstar
VNPSDDLGASRLAPIVSGTRTPGLYRWLSRAHPAAVRRELARIGWDLHCLDGTRIRDTAGLLDACSDALQFPAYFGNNWDALQDCLGDLSWLPDRGRVILWDRFGVLATTDPEAWAIARDVFESAAKERAAAGVPPLYTLVRGDGPTDLPVL